MNGTLLRIIAATDATAAAGQKHDHEKYQHDNYKCFREVSFENINDENNNKKYHKLNTLFLFITKRCLPHMIHVRPTHVLYNFPLVFDTFDVYVTSEDVL